MTKKTALLISFVYVACFVVAFIISVFCSSSWCRIHDDDIIGRLLIIFVPLIPIFLLSLITLKMREEAFRVWWNFARWFAPVIMLVTFLLNTAGNGSGMAGAVGKGFDMFVLGLLYIILVVVSIIQIIRARGKLEGR